jgi:alkylmercury lyase
MSARFNGGNGAAVELRPGVFRPDWTVVVSEAVREALVAWGPLRADLIERWTSPLTETEDLVWRSVIRVFATAEHSPRLADLAAATGLPASRIKKLVLELQRRDLLGLDATAEAIAYAYPFAGRRTGHTVQWNRHALNALCAIDALGVGAMCGRDVKIASSCRSCSAEIRIETVDAGRRLRHVSPPGAVVWCDFCTDDRAAVSCCPRTAFFCSDDHLEGWQRSQDGPRDGCRLTVEEGLELGRAIFGPILAEPGARPQVDRTNGSSRSRDPSSEMSVEPVVATGIRLLG